jgi:hypothetical protein
VSHEPPKIIHLDQLEAVPGPGSLIWRPVRLALGIRAFGCNAYTAGEEGQDVVEPHTEDPVHPESASLHYTLGSLEAARGERSAALASSRKAIDLRPDLARWAPEDEDFESLRDHPEFRALTALP